MASRSLRPRRVRPLRWFRSISVASRLAIAVVAVSVVSLAVATIVGINAGRNLADSITDDRLGALRVTGAEDVENRIESTVRTAEMVAASPQLGDLVERFADARDELAETDLDDIEFDVTELLEQYDEQFFEPFDDVGINADRRNVVDPDEVASITLQTLYSLLRDGEVAASSLDDARDGSTWSAIHRSVHPILREVVERQELVDLFLVEPDSGAVVYSVAKNPDLGTSLDVGPFSGSVVAGAVDAVREDPSSGAVITDVGTYLPAGLDPVGAIAAPVISDGELSAVVVMVYDTVPFTELLSAGGQWDDAGFPPTGDTYMIASDGTLRSDQRSFLETPVSHLDAVEEFGSIDENGRLRIEESGTTVLTERAVEETLNAAEDGDESVAQRPTTTGEPVFSTTQPVAVNLDGVEWYVVSEVNREVAQDRLDDFATLLIVGAAVFVALVAFWAVAWSARMVSSIREMSERLRTWETSTEPIDVTERSPIEIERLAASFTEMVHALESQRDELSAARTKRVELLRALLPPLVAERVASGELDSIEEIPKVSVAVVVVAGLGELVRVGDGIASRELVDRLTGELDELGERHGLERIKIVGDAYYAVCGHNRPYIDHAPRALSFAADAQDAVRDHGRQTEHGLDVVVGIHTGPVNVGLTRASGLVYDVWGPTVSIAHDLSRIGHRGQILVTDATAALLPDSIETTPLPDDDNVSVVSATTVGGTV